MNRCFLVQAVDVTTCLGSPPSIRSTELEIKLHPSPTRQGVINPVRSREDVTVPAFITASKYEYNGVPERRFPSYSVLSNDRSLSRCVTSQSSPLFSVIENKGGAKIVDFRISASRYDGTSKAHKDHIPKWAVDQIQFGVGAVTILPCDLSRDSRGKNQNRWFQDNMLFSDWPTCPKHPR